MKLCLSCHLEFSDEMSVCPKDQVALVLLSGDPLIGTVLQERYRIESIIGRGTMGTVYRANQEIIARQVAVKVLHGHLVNDKEALIRFQQQAKAASRLHHPHIITLYDFGLLAGSRPYIVMDLLHGRSLATILEECGNLSPGQARPILKQVCEALGHAHKHGVIHRDIKPENIVLEEHEKHQVKVVDFGIAKILSAGDETAVRITKTGLVCGSPTYMAPEQFKGQEAGVGSDIYSLAVLVFEILTGRLPFQAVDLVTLMSQHVTQKPPRLSDIRADLKFPDKLEKALQAAMAKNPSDRPGSMEEFYLALEPGLSAGQPAGMPCPENNYLPKAPANGIEDLISARAVSLAKKLEEEGLRQAASQSRQADRFSGKPLAKARMNIPWWIKAAGLGQKIWPVVIVVIASLLFQSRIEPFATLRTKLTALISSRELSGHQPLKKQRKIEH